MKKYVLRPSLFALAYLVIVCVLWYFISSTFTKVDLFISISAFFLSAVFSLLFISSAKNALFFFSIVRIGDHFAVHTSLGETFVGHFAQFDRTNGDLKLTSGKGVVTTVNGKMVVKISTYNSKNGYGEFTLAEFIERFRL